jgi:hypothetical protein
MKKVKLEIGQLALCYCPEWCGTGYHVAKWDGEKFDYDEEPNGNFDNCVEGYLPLNEDGKPQARIYREE